MLKGGLKMLAELWPARESAWTGSMVRHEITSTVGKGKGSGIGIMLDFMMDEDYRSCKSIWNLLKKESRYRAYQLSNTFLQALKNRDNQASVYGMTLVYMDELPDGMGGTLASKLSRVTQRGTLIVSQQESGKLVGEARSFGDWEMHSMGISPFC